MNEKAKDSSTQKGLTSWQAAEVAWATANDTNNSRPMTEINSSQAEKHLTSTDALCTMKGDLSEGTKNVDATALALLNRLHKIEREIIALEDHAQAIKTALELIGVKPEDNLLFPETREEKYVTERPFRHMMLVDACKTILADHPGQTFTVAHVEYLITRGGYRFETENTKNSVTITLSRLAKEGFCVAERKRGSTGNRYSRVKKDAEAETKRA